MPGQVSTGCAGPQQDSRPAAPQRRNPTDQSRTQTRARRPQMARPHAQDAGPVQRRTAEHQPLVQVGQRPTRTRRTPTRLETTTPTTTPTRRRATVLTHCNQARVGGVLVRHPRQDVRHHDVGHRIGKRARRDLNQDDILHVVVTTAAVAGSHLHRVRCRAPVTDEHRSQRRLAAAVDEGNQGVEGAARSGGVTVGRCALGDQAAARWILECRLVKLLNVGAEGVGLFEDPLTLRRSGFASWSMSTGTFPSMLGMMVRWSPAPVIARICDWSSISVSTSTGDWDSSSIAGAARSARPPTACEQPAATTTAAHQTATDLAETGMASSPSRIETNRIEYC